MQGYMKIVGVKFAEKLRAFLKEMREDKYGRAEWFKNSNAKTKMDEIEKEWKRVNELLPIKFDKNGKKVPGLHLDYHMFQYFQEKEKILKAIQDEPELLFPKICVQSDENIMNFMHHVCTHIPYVKLPKSKDLPKVWYAAEEG